MSQDKTSPRHFDYDRHDEEWEKCLSDPDRKKIAQTWLNQHDTFDRWRHSRMYKLLLPLIKGYENENWLTVGDGRFGTDANALIAMGVREVHCSDISDKLLKIGAREGFINDYSAQNAESLTFNDGSFDFVLCKEAYHHFPRPHVALHEMFRVCQKAVVLIEPRDHYIDKGALQWIFDGLLKLIKSTSFNTYSFESIGNFVFSLSERECEKFLLGMNKRFVAFNEMNDIYEPGVEFIAINDTDKTQRLRVTKLKFKLMLMDIFAKLGFFKPRLVFAILFKTQPDEITIKNLLRHGWRVKELPLNPYA